MIEAQNKWHKILEGWLLKLRVNELREWMMLCLGYEYQRAGRRSKMEGGFAV